ncbi:MAG: zinc-dependent metalloprotease, partial [Myxococcota bacterium]
MRKLLTTAVTLGLIGCASEGDIDRTQPGKLPKSMFQGEWYMGLTTIDVPATSTASFVGDQAGAGWSNAEKIVWEVTQTHLFAYRSYEEVPGSDPNVAGVDAQGRPIPGPGHEQNLDPTEQAGAYRENPVAAFAIASHLDVKREYNAATGEQTNVIVENTSDRPWYEREYIRIDWSKNMLASGDDDFFFAQYFTFTTPGTASIARWHSQEEAGGDAIRYIDEDGSCVNFDNLSGGGYDGCVAGAEAKAVTYFDMVSEFYLTPQTAALDFGDGQVVNIPQCLFYASMPATCSTTRMKVRTAFMRVGTVEQVPIAEDSDQTMNVVKLAQREYEPLEYDENTLGKFGFFRTERPTYNRPRGTTETGRIYLANRHAIWKEVWAKDGDGNIALDENGNRIMIPLRDRVPKPIVYHLSPRFRAEMIDGMDGVAESWNRAFRQAVALAKGLMPDPYATIDEVPLCDDPDSDQTNCVPAMYIINRNGWVKDGEEWVYDESREVAKLGDLRYNFIALVDNLQLTSPFGFGPSFADPQTGEIISARAYVYGAVLDKYAENALDIIKLLNCEPGADCPVDINDLIDGNYVREYVENNLAPGDPRARLDERLGDVPIDENLMPQMLGPERFAKLQALGARFDSDPSTAFRSVAPGYAGRQFNKIIGTGLEENLVDNDILLQVAGPALGVSLQGDQLVVPDGADLTPFKYWSSPQMQAQLKWRNDYASAHNIWLAEFSDDGIVGLARSLASEYAGDEAGMRKRLRELILRGVMEHEVGHTLGLMHNFAGSYDSINYHDRYWDLKQETFQTCGCPEDATDCEDDCEPHIVPDDVRDFYNYNTLTETQQNERIREYQYSTVMDYGGTFHSDVHGIGKYDEAAIAFGYAGYVQVFNLRDADAEDDGIQNDFLTAMRQR